MSHSCKLDYFYHTKNKILVLNHLIHLNYYGIILVILVKKKLDLVIVIQII